MDKLLTKEFLEEQYIRSNKSLPDLSKEFGIGKSTISKYLKIHNIKKDNSLRCKNLSKTFQNKSEEEKKLIKEKLSKSLSKVRDIRINSLKESWKNKSEEEINNIKSKIKKTNLKKYGVENFNQLDTQKEHKRNLWKNKSELEKLQYGNKIREAHNNIGISFEQYEILSNKDKFKQYLVEYKNINKEYPTPDTLKEKFNFSNTSGILLYIHQYNLEDYMSWDKSLPEQEVYDYIRSIYKGEIIRDNRSIISKNKELDIYIPEKNLAIEFNGCYWHSKNNGVNKYYHQNKSKECLGKGIRLIHIYEDEWVHKQDIVKDILKTALGVFEKKIYARKCEIRVVDKQTYKDYCQKYHLQGYKGANIILGLYYQDQLTQLASFSKSRYDKNYEYEWIRGVQLPGYQIIGGTSKLFKYFIKNYNPTSIICYSDFNKFSGNSYKNCGFILDKITTPDMWFNELVGLKRINRQPSKHQLTKQLVESGDLLEMHGAGNMKWVWRR